MTNWRRFSGYPGSYPRFEQTSVFSSDPLTPRILYYVDNGKLYRYNTAANALEAGDNIPLGGLTVMTGGYLGWMQSSKDNDWLVFQWNTDSCTPCPVECENASPQPAAAMTSRDARSTSAQPTSAATSARPAC